MTRPLFIYFRHSPKSIKFLPSYDTTAKGESKQIIKSDDENAQFAAHVITCIKGIIQVDGGFLPNYRPNFSQIVQRLTEKAQPTHNQFAGMLTPGYVEVMSQHKYAKIIHIPSDGRMGERIMCIPKKSKSWLTLTS